MHLRDPPPNLDVGALRYNIFAIVKLLSLCLYTDPKANMEKDDIVNSNVKYCKPKDKIANIANSIAKH